MKNFEIFEKKQCYLKNQCSTKTETQWKGRFHRTSKITDNILLKKLSTDKNVRYQNGLLISYYFTIVGTVIII